MKIEKTQTGPDLTFGQAMVVAALEDEVEAYVLTSMHRLENGDMSFRSRICATNDKTLKFHLALTIQEIENALP